ncbi:medium-chain acyl-CoA ligase ACSF2, mitochondrial-like [Amphiura filiformis]|uniref:medium-chain acyl-CoA ligase ACSF2, mitochondrial-like n=1 Tax=Amphiura filiformis TaxID=82378 RepID=UPI003B21801C
MAAKKLTKSYIHVPRKHPFIGLTVGQQLYKMADKYPDKEMFVFYVDTERFTFKQMKEKSQQFAAALISKGLKKGDTIAIWGANHSEWIVAYYACMQLGVLLVPMRLEFPSSTVVALMNKLHCKAMILTRSPSNLVESAYECFPEFKNTSADHFKSASCPDVEFIITCCAPTLNFPSKRGVYSYDEFMTLGNETDMDNVIEVGMSLDMDDPCCMYFTSGSTGMPKPTVHSHHAMLNNTVVFGFGFRAEVENFDCDWDSGRFMAGITFSGGLFGVFLPLIRGCTTIVLYPIFDAEIMAEAIQNERVTHGIAMIHQIHDLVNLPNIETYDFSHFKLMCIGGSIIPYELLQKMNKLVQYTTINFGMTESMILFLGHPLDPQDKLDDAALYPVGGLETKIVDENGRIAPVGTVGELHVRGYSMFKYYMYDDVKTKEIKDHNGWIHSGDLAVMDKDGFIRIKGRIKEYIIKEGLNLAPTELESVLYKHQAVHAALVNVKLIPKHVIFLDTFPVTATGKFSRIEVIEIVTKKRNL